jgi:hypothetical protein
LTSLVPARFVRVDHGLTGEDLLDLLHRCRDRFAGGVSEPRSCLPRALPAALCVMPIDLAPPPAAAS